MSGSLTLAENSKGSLSQFIYIESTGQLSETEDLKLETWDDVQQTKKTLQLSFETLKDALVVILILSYFFTLPIYHLFIFLIHNIQELSKLVLKYSIDNYE